MISAAGVFIWAVLVSQPDATGSTQPPGTGTEADSAAPLPDGPVPLLAGAAMGNGSARAVVVVFSDFECPFCGRFARETLPAIVDDFVKPGLIRFGFRHLPLDGMHPNAMSAAQSAECARSEDRFWQMHDALFTLPMRLAPSDIRKHASAVGLESSRFQGCLSQSANEAIRADLDPAERLGVKGTPTFFFGTSEGGEMVKVVPS